MKENKMIRMFTIFLLNYENQMIKPICCFSFGKLSRDVFRFCAQEQKKIIPFGILWEREFVKGLWHNDSKDLHLKAIPKQT